MVSARFMKTLIAVLVIGINPDGVNPADIVRNLEFPATDFPKNETDNFAIDL